MYKAYLLSALLFSIPSLALAQLLGTEAPETAADTKVEQPEQVQPANATPKAEENTSVQEDALPQLPPVEITPEQKIYARRGIQKNIQTSVVNANKAERKRMLDAVETLQKIKNRRENLKKAPDEQVPYEAPQVNAASRQDVQKYLQETFVDPLDDAFPRTDQEQ